MTVTEPSSNKPAPQDDYIDIIDVMGFLWRAKVYVIVGVLLMILAAIGVINSKKPPVFVSTVPVTLEVAGGISPEQIIGKFNSLLGRADIIKDLNAAGVGFVGGKAPFKLVNTLGVMSLEVSSLSSDPSGERALRAAQVLTEASEKLNKTQTEAPTDRASSKTTTSDLEGQFRQIVAAQVAEEAPFRAKLFALEARLAQKSGRNPLPSTFVKGTSVGDDVMRLFGAAESKLMNSEKAHVIQEYANLVGSIRAIGAKYEDPLIKLSKAMEASSSVLADLVKGYPVLVANEGVYRASVSVGTHERYESKRALFLVLGVLLGGLLGTMAYGLRIFLAENRDRLQAIFSKNS
jgi:hypothetical protein